MLAAVSRILVEAMHSETPVARLRELAEAADDLTDDERHRLLGADPDGVRMASLLVRKLRFERVIRGSDRAMLDYERDPEGFTTLFRAYCEAVPSQHPFPADEARSFLAFADGRDD